MEKTNIMQNLRLNLVLLGRKGAGKSSSGNTILGREAFISEKRSTSVSNKDFASEDGDVGGLPITVYDTPGFSGTESEKELRKYEEVLKKCEPGLCVFLMVLQCDRFTDEDQETVEKIEELLGEKRMQNTWILFTRGDQLKDKNKTINHLIKENTALKKLTQKYEGRFHTFNNKEKKPRNQVDSLISKVFMRNLENLQKKSQRRIPINIQNIPVDSRLSRRIVLLGKSGVGKSAAGNTILGQKEFISEMSSGSVTSKCSVAHATVSGRSVSVVDTPGFFDTKMEQEDLMTEIANSVYLSSPGPHAFLIVFPVNNRFTDQEQQIPQKIEMLFGQDVLKYSIILFTHGDQMVEEEEKSVEELIEENKALRDLVKQCGGGYHVFNNKDQRNREQVNNNKDRLQQKINNKDQNSGKRIPPRGQRHKRVLRGRWGCCGCCGFLPQTKSRSVDGEEVEGLFSRGRNLTSLDQNNREQVNDLLQKIDTMIEQNGGGHYSNQMFEDAERFKREEEKRRKQQVEKEIQEEIERVRKETEEKIKAAIKLEEQRKEEIERVRKEKEEKIRAEYAKRSEERLKAEKDNKSNKGFGQFLSKYWSHILTGAVVAGLIGSGVGAAAGFAVAGAALKGAAIGATAGAVAGAVGTGVYYYKHKE